MQIMTAAGKRYFSLFINITFLTTQKEKFPPETAVTVSLQNNHVITAWLTAILFWKGIFEFLTFEFLLKELLKSYKMPRLSNKSQSLCQKCHILSSLTDNGEQVVFFKGPKFQFLTDRAF